MFKGFDFTDFWTEDEVHDWDDYMESTPSDELIAELEEELGYKLPESYIWLMKQHNGGEPRNTAFPTKKPTSWADDHIAIQGIYGIGREKDWHYLWIPWNKIHGRRMGVSRYRCCYLRLPISWT